jgi:hypothetical protein
MTVYGRCHHRPRPRVLLGAVFTDVMGAGRRATAVDVVLGLGQGQGQGSDTSALLAAAGEAATQRVESVVPAAGVRAIAASPVRLVLGDQTPGGRRLRMPPAPGPPSAGL